MNLGRRLLAWLACEDGKGVIKGIGKIISAPVRGIGHALATSGIPLVKNIGGIAENAGKAFSGQVPFFRGVLPAAGLALGGAGLLGSGPLGGILGGVGKLGGGLLKSGAAKLGLGKLLGGGGGGAPSTDAMGNPVDPSAIDPRSVTGMAPTGGAGDTGGILGKVLGYIGHNPLEAAQVGLAGLNAVQANKLKSQQFGLMNESMGRVNRAADAQVPGFDPYNRLPKVQAMAGAAP